MARRLAVFTICSNNYAAFAKVLMASVRHHHPDADLFVCVADRKPLPDGSYGHDVRPIAMGSLGIPEPAEFAFRYDILELNTAIKPFAFLHLVQDYGYDRVLYFDPDIQLHRPLASVMQALDDGASLVLTPHCCRPNEHDASADAVFLRTGAYNLGFLGAANCGETIDLLRWWARRLRYSCCNDQQHGLFVDQKFMDLAPSFAPRAHISQDSTLNVAYWNLAQRRLERDGACWTVDGRPLTFFHFSGIDPARPDRLSVHTPRFRAPMDQALETLVEGYAAQVMGAGFGRTPMDRYGFGHFASGVPIPGLVRRFFRDRHHAWPEDPFASFEPMLHAPCADATLEAAPYIVTGLIRCLHDAAPWLRGRYDLGRADDVRQLVRWYLRHAMRDFGIDPRLVAPAAALVAERPPRRPAPPAATAPGRTADVSVVGYLRATSGVGEAGRRTLRSLTRLPGLRVEGLEVTLNLLAGRDDDSCDSYLSEAATGRVQIFHINADQLDVVTDALRSRLRADAYKICVPFWELAEIPDRWVSTFDRVDEIWASSRFIQLMLAGRVDKPVQHMPPALEPPVIGACARRQFGLPPGRFLFFFAFDALSYPARKNPMAAIAAFRAAFPTDDAGAGLVIKVLNGARVAAEATRLREAAEGDARIVLIERTLSRQQMTDLTASCDCVLSLHRSEGFGLLIAEAMLLDRPVIATDYGATTELLTPETGFPVGFRMVPVGDGDYPFADGQVWADPDISHAAWQMRLVRGDASLAAARTAAASRLVADRHGVASVAARQRQRLREIGIAA
jgi:glycosyltransferase involved in cell wall biosynthesis